MPVPGPLKTLELKITVPGGAEGPISMRLSCHICNVDALQAALGHVVIRVDNIGKLPGGGRGANFSDELLQRTLHAGDIAGYRELRMTWKRTAGGDGTRYIGMEGAVFLIQRSKTIVSEGARWAAVAALMRAVAGLAAAPTGTAAAASKPLSAIPQYMQPHAVAGSPAVVRRGGGDPKLEAPTPPPAASGAGASSSSAAVQVSALEQRFAAVESAASRYVSYRGATKFEKLSEPQLRAFGERAAAVALVMMHAPRAG